MKKFILILPLLMFGCTQYELGNDKLSLSKSKLIVNAKRNDITGHRKGALEYYEAIMLSYPDSKEAKIAYNESLKIYKSLKDEEGYLYLSEQFLSIYPEDSEANKILFERSKIFKSKYSSKITKWVLKNPDRDIEFLIKSKNELTKILGSSHSNLKKLAQNEIIEIDDILANHELNVAQFYLNKGNTKAAELRAKALIQKYPKASSDIISKAKVIVG